MIIGDLLLDIASIFYFFAPKKIDGLNSPPLSNYHLLNNLKIL